MIESGFFSWVLLVVLISAPERTIIFVCKNALLHTDVMHNRLPIETT